MGIDVSSIQVLLDDLLEIGALGVVLSDSSGLVIASALPRITGDTEMLSESLGALSALVIPQGEQVASYLSPGGEFRDTVIHTNSKEGPRSVLAFTLDSEPKTCIMIISEPALEAQIVHEFARMRDKVINSIQGLAVEVRDLAPSARGRDRKIGAFWETLEDKVRKAGSVEELKRAILDAKDDFLQIHGSYSTVLYSMTRAASRVTAGQNFEVMKEQLLKDIKEWKTKILGELDE